MAQVPEPAEMMFGVENIIRHPNNNEDPPGSSDIMILRLRQQVNLNVFTPLCLPPPSITTSTDFAAEKATLAGWGAIFFPDAADQDSRPIYPGKLQELDQLLTVASSEECVDWFEMKIELGKNLTSAEWLPNLREEALFCARSEDGVSACYKDSGSPLMHEVGCSKGLSNVGNCRRGRKLQRHLHSFQQYSALPRLDCERGRSSLLS